MWHETAWRQRGQASVELVALLPLVVLLGAVVVQVGLAAHAWGAARDAARAGARAHMVGAPARDAARRVLGASLGRDATVTVRRRPDGSERIDVKVRVPMLLPWVPAARVASDVPVPSDAQGA